MIDGQRIRLTGQGGQGSGGAGAGDLYLVVRVAPHPRYRLTGRDDVGGPAAGPGSGSRGRGEADVAARPALTHTSSLGSEVVAEATVPAVGA